MVQIQDETHTTVPFVQIATNKPPFYCLTLNNTTDKCNY